MLDPWTAAIASLTNPSAPAIRWPTSRCHVHRLEDGTGDPDGEILSLIAARPHTPDELATILGSSSVKGLQDRLYRLRERGLVMRVLGRAWAAAAAAA